VGLRLAAMVASNDPVSIRVPKASRESRAVVPSTAHSRSLGKAANKLRIETAEPTKDLRVAWCRLRGSGNARTSFRFPRVTRDRRSLFLLASETENFLNNKRNYAGTHLTRGFSSGKFTVLNAKGPSKRRIPMT
jgi:hypothetical protein